MGFGVQDGRELKDLELLTELQHFGAATCLLDFTENAFVALYMACKDLDTVDGKVYVLPDANLEIVSVNTEIEDAIKRSSPVKFIPHMHGSAERRIIRQAGVFIIGLDGQSDFTDLSTHNLYFIFLACSKSQTTLYLRVGHPSPPKGNYLKG